MSHISCFSVDAATEQGLNNHSQIVRDEGKIDCDECKNLLIYSLIFPLVLCFYFFTDAE
jgi:hypothetical protein